MVRDRVRATVSVLALAAAMGAHESGIMWLPAAVLVRYGMGDRSTVRALARHYTPAFFLLIGYAGLTTWINSHNYVITEGRYGPGAHMVTNLVKYLVALYAGRQRSIEYVFVIVLIGFALWRGTPRVRAWCLWLVAALVPVLAFTTPPASRYLYVPAIPFCFLIAAGIGWITRTIAARTLVASGFNRILAWAPLLLITAFVAGRSALFAHKGGEGFRNDAAPYAALASNPAGARSEASSIDPQYLDPLARVATCNPRATFTGR
jgi:hypothetical protein